MPTVKWQKTEKTYTQKIIYENERNQIAVSTQTNVYETLYYFDEWFLK